MKDKDKTKQQIINELVKMRQRIAEMETSETHRKQVEVVLKESKEKYRELFESAPESIVLVGLDGIILDCNNTALKISGLPKEEIVGKQFTEMGIFKEKDLPKYVELFSRLANGKSVEPLEVELIVKHNETRWIEVFPGLLKKDNEIYAIQVIARDITEHKKMEDMLKESEEHARIFASYQHAISELRKFYVGEVSFEQMFQKTVDLFVKDFGYYMTWYGELKVDEKVIIPKVWAGKYEKYLDGLQLELDDSKDAKCAMSLAIVRKEPFGYADLEHDKDFKKWRPLALKYGYRSNQAIPLIVKGKCTGAFLIYSTRPRAFSEILIRYLMGIVNELATIVEKITERKRAEEVLRKAHDKLEIRVEERTAELAKANEELRIEITERKRADEALKVKDSAIASSINAIAMADLEGNLTYINDSFLKLWGYDDGKQVLGRPAVEFWELEEKATEVIEALRDRGSWVGELVARRKDGALLNVELSASMVTDQVGKPICMMASFVDITERKRAEEALKEREKELEIKTSNLEEVNAALKVLLKKRDEDKTELEEKVLFNMKELVMPYLEKLNKSGLDERQEAYFSILQSNLTDIISPFSRRMSTKYLNLTPGEIQVANLVRHGKGSKEIADLLNVSIRTIEAYRDSIRKKIGIKHKKANLRTHLLSIQ